MKKSEYPFIVTTGYSVVMYSLSLKISIGTIPHPKIIMLYIVMSLKQFILESLQSCFCRIDL